MDNLEKNLVIWKNIGYLEKFEIWKDLEIWGKNWKSGNNLEILKQFANLEIWKLWEKI